MHLFREPTGYYSAASYPQTAEIYAVWPNSQQIVVKRTIDYLKGNVFRLVFIIKFAKGSTRRSLTLAVPHLSFVLDTFSAVNQIKYFAL